MTPCRNGTDGVRHFPDCATAPHRYMTVLSISTLNPGGEEFLPE